MSMSYIVFHLNEAMLVKSSRQGDTYSGLRYPDQC